MEKEFRTRVEGELNIDRWGTNLRAGVENVKNYTCNTLALLETFFVLLQERSVHVWQKSILFEQKLILRQHES